MIPKLLIVVVLILALVIYLNRSYAYFFDHIGQENLTDPNVSTKYSFTNENAPVIKDVVFVALGDSLTAGVGGSTHTYTYPYLIGKNLSRKYSKVTLFNFGEPGAQTDRLTNYQIPRINDLYPEYVSVLIGINDVLGIKSENEFSRNYTQILDQITRLKNTEVYVINIPYLGSSKTTFFPYNILLDLRIQQFNRIIGTLVKKYPVHYIDLYSQTSIASKDVQYYSLDGFHPSDIGYNKWGEIINASFDK